MGMMSMGNVIRKKEESMSRGAESRVRQMEKIRIRMSGRVPQGGKEK